MIRDSARVRCDEERPEPVSAHRLRHWRRDAPVAFRGLAKTAGGMFSQASKQPISVLGVEPRMQDQPAPPRCRTASNSVMIVAIATFSESA